MKLNTLALTTSLVALLASPVLSQATLTGVEALEDRIEDIEDDAKEDIRRGEDKQRFGPLGVVQGWRGSMALTGAATSGNTDTTDLSLAGRLNYGVNEWNHSFGFAAEHGKANGVRNKDTIYGIYEGSRYFTPRFYAFGTARVEFDNFATNKVDGFLGFGPGYRIVNNQDVAWRVQAGPGIRYVKNQAGISDTEAGFIASSRFFYAITDTVSLTNDTDVLGSSTNTIATNDLGFNFKVSQALTTRISYRSEYNSKPTAGLKSTDNTLGISLVLGF